jgi:hypothetical protein
MDADVETAIATARDFQRRAQAARVVIVLDRGEREPVMIDAEPALTTLTEGDTVTEVAHTNAVPKPLPEVRPAPASAISLDTTTGELVAPIGAIEHLALSVKALARAFGGLTVATAEFATSDIPITFAARDGEPVVLQAADDQYELDV